MLRVYALVIIVACVGPSAIADGAPVLGQRALKSLDGRSVTLERGRLQTQVETTREYYLRIPNDDLLKGFRARAGKPAYGSDLGGWYSSDIFSIFGQVLSGLSRLYRATGDEGCKDKAIALIEGWAECIADDGFFFYSDKPNAHHYVYDKMVGGLVDAYLYCGYEPALRYLSRITDWAEKNLVRGRPYADGTSDTEWYTLTENLYRAYLATGDERYRGFGKVWEYREYWDLYARGLSIFGERPSGGRTGAYHAYSHVNNLGGLGASYLVTGDRDDLQTLVKAYDYLQAHQCYATGGYGPDEQLLPRDELVRRLRTTHNSFETQCGSWAAFKMSKYLITCTGEARYGDWVERLIYNGIGAEIPMDADGNTFYYSDYDLGGGRKTHTAGAWPCCAGTHPMAVADYSELIYFEGPRGLFVNLFVPSTVELPVDGRTVRIRQQTRFPETPDTELIVETTRPARFDIAFRVPAWVSSRPQVEVDGSPIAGPAVYRGWATVRRTWRDGDRMRVVLPMGLWSESLDPSAPYPAAVLYGPVVLAFRAPHPRALRSLDLDRLADELVADRGEPSVFRLARDPGVTARPFYAYAQGEPYYMYVSPDMAQFIATTECALDGAWPVNAGTFRATDQIGSSVECTFEGTGVTWVGSLFDDAGIAEVRIDGTVVAQVDQYDPGRGIPFRWDSRELAPGRHAIRLTLIEAANPASKGHYINLSGFEIR